MPARRVVRARLIGTAVAIGLLVAACGMIGPTGIASEVTENGRVACTDTRAVRAGMGGDANGMIRVLSCAEAVAAAQAKVASSGAISSILFSRALSIYGPECNGNPVPCPYPQMGIAFFEFVGGAPVHVGVQLVDGLAVAGEPAPGSFADMFPEP